jgi:hypothetical protein
VEEAPSASWVRQYSSQELQRRGIDPVLGRCPTIAFRAQTAWLRAIGAQEAIFERCAIEAADFLRIREFIVFTGAAHAFGLSHFRGRRCSARSGIDCDTGDSRYTEITGHGSRPSFS